MKDTFRPAGLALLFLVVSLAAAFSRAVWSIRPSERPTMLSASVIFSRKSYLRSSSGGKYFILTNASPFFNDLRIYEQTELPISG